ncbi:MAG: cysteine--tRNA ligase [Candidatus Omnitrophica bacterium]|nr:cysteine--tRNA ligase [Candidatus Omnitrophota bacterium]MCM8803100.1 cysteine--tRNA ligase [Candidatus Omnitrophota bacterium]
MVRFYNTLTKKKEDFYPIEDKIVKMYTCGPTVYDFAHIGNFRAYVFEDLLHRFLEYIGYKVIRVMNITDVDDKTIKGAKKEGISLKEYTDRYIKYFLEDINTLRLKKPDFMPRATEHIKEMVELIKKLLNKGYAYYKDGSIYFSISKFSSYGKLSGIDLSNVKIGASVDADEYEKEDVRDFVLWKKAKEEEGVYWDTEIGKGRPGWHIECSAMSMKYLGETFDIHTGGVDNIFPHHENEIAQSESATGKKFVNYWLHCAHLLVNGEKMSKSKGNFYTLRDLLNKNYNPVAIRYLLLSTHYRDPLNFTEQSLRQAENTVRNYNEFYKGLNICASEKYNQMIKQEIEKAKKGFIKELSDDLNISSSLSSIFNFIKTVNIFFSKGEFGKENVKEVKEFMEDIDRVLCIIERKEEFLPEEILDLIKEREKARKDRDFEKADKIREFLKQKKIILEDTPYGTRWKKLD